MGEEVGRGERRTGGEFDLALSPPQHKESLEHVRDKLGEASQGLRLRDEEGAERLHDGEVTGRRPHRRHASSSSSSSFVAAACACSARRVLLEARLEVHIHIVGEERCRLVATRPRPERCGVHRRKERRGVGGRGEEDGVDGEEDSAADLRSERSARTERSGQHRAAQGSTEQQVRTAWGGECRG